jgi:hypothetical protein
VDVGFRPEIIHEVNVWSVITHELVRQVYVHCEERGLLLNRARTRLLEVTATGMPLYLPYRRKLSSFCADTRSCRRVDAMSPEIQES